MKTILINMNDGEAGAFEIVSAAFVDTNDFPDWKITLHSHAEELQLIFVAMGSGTMYNGQHIYCFSQGDLLIQECGVLHSERTDPGVRSVLYMINLKQTPGAPRAFPDGAPPRVSVFERYSLFLDLFQFLWDTTDRCDAAANALRQSGVQFLLSLTREHFRADPSGKDPSRMETLMEEVLRYLDDCFPRTVPLEELAKQFYFSPYYLARQFKAYTGFTVNQYQISRRIGEAERLLLYSTMCIRDIADACGYRDIHYFYGSFKRLTGFTPVAFREKYQNQAEESST